MKAIPFALRYVNHLFHLRNRKGHRVHSPFSYYFITKIIGEKTPFYVFSKIEYLRSKLQKDDTAISVADFGTGISEKKTIKQLVKREVKPAKYAQLLFRIIHYTQAKNMLELGTSVGITTAYLASVDSRSLCISMDGCPQKQQIAKQNLKELGIDNVRLVCGNIDDHLVNVLEDVEKLDFVYFDANHTYAATRAYFEACITKAHSKSVFVFDDIHWSGDMERLWDFIKSDSRVIVSFDVFGMGIVFFNPDIPKQSYKILF